MDRLSQPDMPSLVPETMIYQTLTSTDFKLAHAIEPLYGQLFGKERGEMKTFAGVKNSLEKKLVNQITENKEN